MTGPALAPGDRLLLQQILRDTGVESVPGRPGTADYMLVLARALAERLQRAMEPVAGLFGTHASTLLLAAEVFLIGVLALLVFVVIRWIVSRRSVRRRRSAEDAASVPPLAGEEGELARGLEAWASELERHLQAGDARGALKALWWWLARALCGPDADPSWTSRELLDRARRPDLRTFAAAFDRLAYGREAPRVPDVRDLVGRLRSVLA
jgi:hypothetical protein